MKSKLSPRNVQRRREGTVSAKVGSLKYAAMKIGCSLPTLYELIEGGKLRSYHIGRAHHVSEQAVAELRRRLATTGWCSAQATSRRRPCPAPIMPPRPLGSTSARQ